MALEYGKVNIFASFACSVSVILIDGILNTFPTCAMGGSSTPNIMSGI